MRLTVPSSIRSSATSLWLVRYFYTATLEWRVFTVLLKGALSSEASVADRRTSHHDTKKAAILLLRRDAKFCSNDRQPHFCSNDRQPHFVLMIDNLILFEWSTTSFCSNDRQPHFVWMIDSLILFEWSKAPFVRMFDKLILFEWSTTSFCFIWTIPPCKKPVQFVWRNIYQQTKLNNNFKICNNFS
jgi:hypothetical protein